MDVGAELIDRLEKYFGTAFTRIILITVTVTAVLGALSLSLTPILNIADRLMGDDREAQHQVSTAITLCLVLIIVVAVSMLLHLHNLVEQEKIRLDDMMAKHEAQSDELYADHLKAIEEIRNEVGTAESFFEVYDRLLLLVPPDTEGLSKIKTELEKTRKVLNAMRIQPYRKRPKLSWPPTNDA